MKKEKGDRMDNMRGKKVMITGGANGIGAETVRAFAKIEADLFFVDIDKKASEKLVKEFNNDQVHYFIADVTDPEQMKQATKKMVTVMGGIDILFANAGIHYSADILSTNEEDWERLFDVNVKGVFITIKQALPYMINGGGGSIILNGSDQSFVGKKGNLAYGATKGAVGQMTKTLSIELAEHNIRVNCVCPGTIETPLVKKAVASKALKSNESEMAIYSKLKSAQPIKRLGDPKEVAQSVCFLASEGASYITGSLLTIDGGYTAQ